MLSSISSNRPATCSTRLFSHCVPLRRGIISSLIVHHIPQAAAIARDKRERINEYRAQGCPGQPISFETPRLIDSEAMTELIWDGKYVDSKRQAPVRVALPFQTIETVNESIAERQRTLEWSASGKQAEWRNRLIWGDKKYVLPSLLPGYARKRCVG